MSPRIGVTLVLVLIAGSSLGQLYLGPHSETLCESVDGCFDEQTTPSVRRPRWIRLTILRSSKIRSVQCSSRQENQSL
jgi:hypothetical protein